jgi:hypothetical protein
VMGAELSGAVPTIVETSPLIVLSTVVRGATNTRGLRLAPAVNIRRGGTAVTLALPGTGVAVAASKAQRLTVAGRFLWTLPAHSL